MKNFLLFVLLFGAHVCVAQNMTISIDKDLAAGQKLPTGADYENYLIQNLITYKIDTVKVKNGKIQIANQAKMITPFAIARNNPRQAFIFFVEPKKDFKMTISEPSLTVKKVSGSESQNKYIAFMAKQSKLQNETQKLQQAQPTTKNQDSLAKKITYNQMLLNTQYLEFINQERDNNLGAYMVFDIANKNQRISAKDLNGLYNKLSDAGKNTFIGKKVGERVNRLGAMDMGNVAPDFTLTDMKGKKHTLSDLRGKYVLVDFWASWCGPCVKEIPSLKKAYAEYHDNGFEIVSVSIDAKKTQWLRALEKYDMPWIGLIDNEDPAKKITQTLYYVPTIPRTILLDKKGVVIGKDFRGGALEAKLAELFN